MGQYEQEALREALIWKRKMERNSSMIIKGSKQIQTKINEKIPQKVHRTITDSVRKMMELSLTSSSYIYSVDAKEYWTFEEREREVKRRLNQYRKTAMVEGAGTGAGGVFLGLADFPMLLSIKMKFLFDAGQIYGIDVRRYEERMFLLHTFMVAYSSEEKRRKALYVLVNWEQEKLTFNHMDWQTLQQEYRDSLDVVKMLQLVPGFGAIVGAWANRKLMNQLGETVMNVYRLRLLQSK
ncbi:EcsC family protein [Salirhabdus salicampi]|uniref:EcsC family protein n=1 Tax=Salirhabdus salicampi TaxID=476102 RepID=UPI0020C4671F|nr:EcsC family protein [Salirhabdus salicampi]MCP8615515.1 EcsC family protein [Salirhabdus salicampi]